MSTSIKLNDSLQFAEIASEPNAVHFAEHYFFSGSGLAHWGDTPASVTANDPAFWERLFRAFIVVPPPAKASVGSPMALVAMACALSEPGIAPMVAIKDKGGLRETSCEAASAWGRNGTAI